MSVQYLFPLHSTGYCSLFPLCHIPDSLIESEMIVCDWDTQYSHNIEERFKKPPINKQIKETYFDIKEL